MKEEKNPSGEKKQNADPAELAQMVLDRLARPDSQRAAGVLTPGGWVWRDVNPPGDSAVQATDDEGEK